MITLISSQKSPTPNIFGPSVIYKYNTFSIIHQTLYLSVFFIVLGIRSDSDMYSYSFSWKVWKSAKIIASGEEIKKYLTTAVEEEGNFSTALYIITI